MTRRRIPWPAASAISLLLAPASVFAQAGPIDRFGATSKQQVEITAGTDDGTASVSFELSGVRRHRSASDRNVETVYLEQLNLIVSTPFDGETDAMPATLDALANGTKATLRYGQFGGAARLDISADAERIFIEAQGICRRKAEDSYAEELAALAEGASAELRKAVADRRKAALAECDDPAAGSESLVVTHLAAKLGDYQEAQIPADAFDWGVELSFGYDKFDYVDPVTLADLETKKVQFGASLNYTRYIRGSLTAIGVSGGYQRGYEAADEVVLCPAAAAVPVTCKSASPAAPGLDENLLAAIELRHRFKTREGKPASFAIAPRLSFDAIDEVWGVDVPLYFIGDGDGGLSGGVRGGWRSDTDKITFGVFIGTGFSLTGG